MDNADKRNVLDRPLPSLLNLAQSQSHNKNQHDLVPQAIASAQSFSSFVIPGAAAGSILNLLPELQPSSSKYYIDESNLREWSLLDRSLLETIEPYAIQLSSSIYETYTFMNEMSGHSGLRLAKNSRPLSIAACFFGVVNKKYQKGLRVSSDRQDSHRTVTVQRDTPEDQQNIRFEYQRGGSVRRDIRPTDHDPDKDEFLQNLNLQDLRNFLLDVQKGNFDIVGTSTRNKKATDEMLGELIKFKSSKDRLSKVKPKKSVSFSQAFRKKKKKVTPKDDQVMFFLYSGDGQKYSCSFEKIKESVRPLSFQTVSIPFPNQSTSRTTGAISKEDTQINSEKGDDIETLMERLNFYHREHFDDYDVNSREMDYLYAIEETPHSVTLKDELDFEGGQFTESDVADDNQRSVSVPNLIACDLADNKQDEYFNHDIDERDETKSLAPVLLKPTDSSNLRVNLLKNTIKNKVKKRLPLFKPNKVYPAADQRRSRSTQKYDECMNYITALCIAPTKGFKVALYVQTPCGFDKCKLKTDFLLHLMKLFFSSPKAEIDIISVPRIADELEPIIEQYKARPKFPFDFESALICRAVLVVPNEVSVLIRRRNVFFLDNICEVLEISQDQLMVLLAQK